MHDKAASLFGHFLELPLAILWQLGSHALCFFTHMFSPGLVGLM